MSDQHPMKPTDPVATVERVIQELTPADINDLSDATDAAVEGGGGFGWVDLPSRDLLERFWQGVIAMPARVLFVARLDGVICGTCQLIMPPVNNEAQSHAVQLTTSFIAPWARGHNLAHMLITQAEEVALEEGFSVINLDVRETMEGAIKLYEDLGYTRIGEHPYYARVKNEVVKGYYYYKVIDPKAVEQEP